MQNFIVFNPSSGSYSISGAKKIAEQLLAAGTSATIITPFSEADAIKQVRFISETKENPLFIAVGGDGTLNTVINGMIPCRGTVGVIPLGTANVIANELKISSTTDAINRISRGKTAPFNVGIATSATKSRRFFLMAGMGLDGEIVSTVKSNEKKLLGKAAYLLSALRILKNNKRPQLTINCENMTIIADSVVISNSRYYAGKFVAADTSIFDYDFCIVPFPAQSRIKIARFIFETIITGKMPQKEIKRINGDKIIRISGNSYCQLDGDPFDNAPLTLSMLHNFARIII